MAEENKKVHIIEGVVVKSAMQDTVTVMVSRYVKHPKYKKYQRKMKKFLVHNPGNSAKVGDRVQIKPTRPLSKRKHYEIAALITSAATE